MPANMCSDLHFPSSQNLHPSRLEFDIVPAGQCLHSDAPFQKACVFMAHSSHMCQLEMYLVNTVHMLLIYTPPGIDNMVLSKMDHNTPKCPNLDNKCKVNPLSMYIHYYNCSTHVKSCRHSLLHEYSMDMINSLMLKILRTYLQHKHDKMNFVHTNHTASCQLGSFCIVVGECHQNMSH